MSSVTSDHHQWASKECQTHTSETKQICSFVELTVKTLRCLPRNVISYQVNKSQRVHHKLMNTLDQTFQIEQETVCSAWGRLSEVGGEDSLTDCSHSRTQNGCEVWPQTQSCDSSAITSDLTKAAGWLLTLTVANTAAADSAPSGSVPTVTAIHSV